MLTPNRFLLLLFLLLPSITRAAFDSSECGKTKNCVENPPKCLTSGNSICQYLFSYKQNDTNHLSMELQTHRSTAQVGYISVGFSADNQMGEDSVTHCAIAAGSNGVEVHTSQNPGKNNIPQNDLKVETDLLQLEAAEVTENYIYCRFIQKSSPNSNDLFSPDFSKPFYILLARGPTSGSSLRPHSFDPSSNDFPYVSPQPLDLFKRSTKPNSINLDAEQARIALKNSTKQWLVRLHGVLMIIAWLSCITVAIYSARYLGKIWPNTTPLGLKIWFHIHRTLNVCAVVLMVLAALSICVGKDFRWTGPWLDKDADLNLSAGGIHSIAGLIATFFAITQPFGALLRCSNDHSKRPIFNGIHHIIGYLALIFAMISITIAVFKFKSLWVALPEDSNLAFLILIVFFVLSVLVVILSEVLKIRSNKENQRVTAIEMHSRAKGANSLLPNPTPSDTYYYQTQKIANTKYSRASQILFGVFSFIACATSAFLVLHLLYAAS